MKLKLFRLIAMFILSAVLLSGCSLIQNAYDKGYKEGYNAAKEELGTYEEGYYAGYYEAMDNTSGEWDDGYDYGYKEGYNDAMREK